MSYDTSAPTKEKNHKNVLIGTNSFQIRVMLKGKSAATQEKNHSNALFATYASMKRDMLHFMSIPTLEKSLVCSLALNLI